MPSLLADIVTAPLLLTLPPSLTSPPVALNVFALLPPTEPVIEILLLVEVRLVVAPLPFNAAEMRTSSLPGLSALVAVMLMLPDEVVFWLIVTVEPVKFKPVKFALALLVVIAPAVAVTFDEARAFNPRAFVPLFNEIVPLPVAAKALTLLVPVLRSAVPPAARLIVRIVPETAPAACDMPSLPADIVTVPVLLTLPPNEIAPPVADKLLALVPTTEPVIATLLFVEVRLVVAPLPVNTAPITTSSVPGTSAPVAVMLTLPEDVVF